MCIRDSDDLALMVSGFPVPTKIREYAATSQELKTKAEIFSAMVVYGFLSYENGKAVSYTHLGTFIVNGHVCWRRHHHL